MKHFTFIFKSLYKNDYCIDGGRKYKWWVALIFFFLSTIISVIPITTSLFTQDAGLLITSATYDIDKGFVSFIEQLNKDNITLTFHNSILDSNFDTTKSAYLEMGNTWTDKIYTFTQELSIEDTTNDNNSSTSNSDEGSSISVNQRVKNSYTQKEIEYFHVFLIDVDKEGLTDRIKTVLLGNNPTLKDEDGNYIKPDESNTNYKATCSFLIIGKESYALYKYGANYTSTYVNPTSAIVSSYSNVKVRTLNDLLISGSFSNSVENIAQFIRDSYYPTVVYNSSISLSIYLTINITMIFLMGLVLFIMTRGKQNPFRIYKFHECLKISCWESFSPAVLSLILGFIMPSSGLAAFFFALLLGLRTMWLGMKNLRPMPQA